MHPWSRVLMAAALAAIVFALNTPTWDYGFVYDDRAVVVDRAPFSEQGVRKFFTTRQWGTGRHAVTLSFDLNRTAPPAPRPFHVVNTCLAAVATILVFALGMTLGLHPPAAFLAAALFAVHPIHTDAIVSITGRAELMAGIAVLGCMLLHARGYPLRAITLPAAALLFFVGVESKENALALPVLLVLYDFLLAPAAPLRSRIAPYLAYAAAGAAWVALAAPNWGTLDPVTYVDNPIAFLPFYERIPRAAAILWHYFGLVLLPISLKPDRSFATTMPSMTEGIVGLLAWFAVLVACWRARLRDPLAVFLTLWFPAAFAVTANILYPVGTIMAERLVFTPSVGVFLLAGLLFDRATAEGWLRRSALTAAAGAAALLLAFAYDSRARVWANDAHYHLVAAFESPNSAKAHYNLGLERASAQDFAAAEAAFREALQIYPKFGLAAYYLAGVLIETERPAEAVDVYKAYLAQVPDDAAALSQLIALELSVDRYDDARANAQRLVAMNPNDSTYLGLLERVEMLQRGQEDDPSVLEGQFQDGQAKPAH